MVTVRTDRQSLPSRARVRVRGMDPARAGEPQTHPATDLREIGELSCWADSWAAKWAKGGGRGPARVVAAGAYGTRRESPRSQ